MKVVSGGRLKLIVGGIAVAAMLAAGGYYGGRLLPIEIRVGAAAGAGQGFQSTAHAAAEKPPVGVMYPLGERVVNLADTGGYRYLKLGIGLEFAAEGEKEAEGEAYKKMQEEFAKKLLKHKERLEDIVTTVSSSRTSADLATVAGKEALRLELREKIAAAAQPEHLLGVYFTQFIIQ